MQINYKYDGISILAEVFSKYTYIKKFNNEIQLRIFMSHNYKTLFKHGALLIDH